MAFWALFAPPTMPDLRAHGALVIPQIRGHRPRFEHAPILTLEYIGFLVRADVNRCTMD